MKPYIKQTHITFALSILFFSIFLILGCFKKADTKTPTLTTEQIVSNIIKDSNFTNYKSDLNLLINGTNSRIIENKISEQDFIKIFKEAVENNSKSKEEVSSYLGFQNAKDFWNIRARLNISLSNLIKNYDFKKISKNQWFELIKNENHTKQSLITIKPNMLNPNNCIEQFKDCIDDANAQYAVETLGCVGWGALGWTVVGGVLFVGCEGLSYYHLTTMKRKCDSSFKGCK